MTKWRQVVMVIVTLGVTAVLLNSQCANSVAKQPAKAVITVPAFDKTRAWADLVRQVAFGYRIPGTDAHKQTRDWLVRQLKPFAAAVTLQPFTHLLGGRETRMWNIIATLPGTGKAPRELVLLCAHWDTRPTADKDPDPALRKLPIDGANDGASGVAVMLEIARQLKAHPVACDVVIVLFDGEDYGPKLDNMLLGSKYYAAHLPQRKPDWGVLLDMVGDKDLHIYREPSSDKAARWVNNMVFRAAREMGYLEAEGGSGFVDGPYTYEITDDHTPLNAAGVPTIDLIDFDYPAWHTRADKVDQCSADSLEKVGITVLRTLQTAE
ncbi:MAG: M28 family peptidase [Armatimonadota bacterium]